jgi:hypothetical protein
MTDAKPEAMRAALRGYVAGLHHALRLLAAEPREAS